MGRGVASSISNCRISIRPPGSVLTFSTLVNSHLSEMH